MPFGTDFYRSVVLGHVTQSESPCKPMNTMEPPAYREARVFYVDPSVLLALLKRERCEHVDSSQIIARLVDRFEEDGRKIIISGLAEYQVLCSLDLKGNYRFREGFNGYGKDYYDLCMGRLARSRIVERPRRSRPVRELWSLLDKSEAGWAFRDMIEDYVHAHLAREANADGILTYDPIFLGLSEGRVDIRIENKGPTIHYIEKTDDDPLAVVCPEQLLGIVQPCFVK